MIELSRHPVGCLLPVHALPGSRRSGIVGEHDGRLKVAVTQVAEKGKANKELIKVLAACLGVSKSAISLISGETSSRKVFLITGASVDSIREKLDMEFLG